MKRYIVLVIGFLLMIGGSLYAQKPGPNSSPSISIPLIKEYKVRKGTIKFPHGKHFLDYQLQCSVCHHEKKVKKDDKFVPQPLTVKKIKELEDQGKNPFQCKTCHGKLNKKDFRKLFHKNCLKCHKALKTQGKKAPTKCRDCHIKNKKRQMIEGC